MGGGKAMAPRHPLGVVRLCVAEAFERFSYYTMAAVLVLFLAGSTAHGGFGWKDADAIAYYGTYVGLLWLMPLFGGWSTESTTARTTSFFLSISDGCPSFLVQDRSETCSRPSIPSSISTNAP